MVLLMIAVVGRCMLLGVDFILVVGVLLGVIAFWLVVSCLAVVVRACCCVMLFGWGWWCLGLWALVVSECLLVGWWLLVG